MQRSRLLQSAQDLLTSTPGELSLRQVALRAEVTPPLAHYYFGNREGLLRALVEQRAAPAVEQLLDAVRASSPRPVAALTRLMQQLTLLAASDVFIRRCLLLSAGEPLRDRLRDQLGELLQRAQTSGQLRADLAPAYLANALLGLCLFPYLDAGGEQIASERATALIRQHVALLQQGIRDRAPPAAGAFRGT